MSSKKSAKPSGSPKGGQSKQKGGNPLVVSSVPRPVSRGGSAGLQQRVKAAAQSTSTANKTLMSFMNAGSEVSSKEVTLKITKYLDWARGEGATSNVLNITYDMEQDLLAPDATNNLGNNAVLSRVKRCRLSAYPRSNNAQNAESVYAVLTSVPVRGGGGNAELNAHQQSVVVPPTFTPDWHKVFDCDYDKLFSSAQVQPVDSINFPLLNTSIVDVDNFDPLLQQAVQLKLEIWVAQTVPLRSNILLGTAYQADYVNSTSTASDQLAFVQVLGMSDRT